MVQQEIYKNFSENPYSETQIGHIARLNTASINTDSPTSQTGHSDGPDSLNSLDTRSLNSRDPLDIAVTSRTTGQEGRSRHEVKQLL